jgi:hypothetical protein
MTSQRAVAIDIRFMCTPRSLSDPCHDSDRLLAGACIKARAAPLFEAFDGFGVPGVHTGVTLIHSGT